MADPSGAAACGACTIAGRNTAVRRHTVLVIEDDPDLITLIEMLLTDEGYGCVSCPSVAEALMLLTRQPVDLILTDSFSLTATDVLTPMAPVLAASGGIPVVLLTAFPVEGGDARAAGFAAVQCKPFDVEDLLAQVAVLLADDAADALTAR
jgi:CheY-like chemotaxis protein